MKPYPVSVLLCYCCIVSGQVDRTSFRFDAASVKVSRGDVAACKGGPGTTDPGLFTCTNTNLLSLLVTAFHVNPYQIQSADSMTGYDISAKMSARTTKDQFDLMLQNLLIERFGLVYHFEKRVGTVFDLVVSKRGLKMQESPPSDPSSTVESSSTDDSAQPKASRPSGLVVDAAGFPKVAPPKRGSISMAAQDGFLRLVCRDASIQLLAGILAAQLGGPVTDSTGLKANYDFTVFWIAPGLEGTLTGPTPSEAVEEQLGLRLVRSRGPIDLLIIDHVARTPVEN